MSQVGDVLRALGQNPTEGDVKKLVQTTKVSWTLYTAVHYYCTILLYITSQYITYVQYYSTLLLYITTVHYYCILLLYITTVYYNVY